MTLFLFAASADYAMAGAVLAGLCGVARVMARWDDGRTGTIRARWRSR